MRCFTCFSTCYTSQCDQSLRGEKYRSPFQNTDARPVLILVTFFASWPR